MSKYFCAIHIDFCLMTWLKQDNFCFLFQYFSLVLGQTKKLYIYNYSTFKEKNQIKIANKKNPSWKRDFL